SAQPRRRRGVAPGVAVGAHRVLDDGEELVLEGGETGVAHVARRSPQTRPVGLRHAFVSDRVTASRRGERQCRDGERLHVPCPWKTRIWRSSSAENVLGANRLKASIRLATLQ